MTRLPNILPAATFGQRKVAMPKAAEVPAHVAAEWIGERPANAAQRLRDLLA